MPIPCQWSDSENINELLYVGRRALGQGNRWIPTCSSEHGCWRDPADILHDAKPDPQSAGRRMVWPAWAARLRSEPMEVLYQGTQQVFSNSWMQRCMSSRIPCCVSVEKPWIFEISRSLGKRKNCVFRLISRISWSGQHRRWPVRVWVEDFPTSLQRSFSEKSKTWWKTNSKCNRGTSRTASYSCRFATTLLD